MIIHVITANANPGKFASMGEWAKKVAAMIKENHDVELTVLHNVTGSGDEWHFMTTHDSLAALETYTNAVSAAPQFLVLAQEINEQALWQSTRTSMFRTAF